jgi:hypothetical protein
MAAGRQGVTGRAGALRPSPRFLWPLAAALWLLPAPALAQSLDLETAPGGITISRSGSNHSGTLGSVNALGLGTPGTGVTLMTSGLSGGVLYTTPYRLRIGGAGNNNLAVVRAYVSTAFSSTAADVRACYPSTSCATASALSPVSFSPAAMTDVIPIPGVLNGTYTGIIGIFVGAVSGVGALNGSASTTITFNTYRWSSKDSTLTYQSTDTLTLAVTFQQAVRLTVATSGGLTVADGSTTSYEINYGTVDGLGISSPAGSTRQVSASGTRYSTPYALQPTFTGFSSSTATLRGYVSTNFARSAVLQLQHSATGAEDSFTPFSTSAAAGQQTVVSSTAASGSALIRHLGLFVSPGTGTGASAGNDSAIITFTLIVP